MNINNTDSMRLFKSLPNVAIVNEAISFSECSSNESSIELPSKTSCKYYSMKEYQLLNKKRNLHIFLASKPDNLQEFLAGSSTKLDIVTITKTSEKEDIGFLNNLEIEGYEIYHRASKSSKGGTAIFVNKNFDFFLSIK